MKKINKASDKIYIAMPKQIYINKDISHTDKIILSWFTSFKSEWNALTTKTIADTLNLSVSAVRESIKRLVFLDLLSQKYWNARKRVFKSNIKKSDDIVVVIPNEILTLEVSSTYKVTMGYIISASMGKNNKLAGYNFNHVTQLAKHLNLSTSSVYRHITLLEIMGYIRRDEASNWLLRPQDKYFKERQAKINRGLDRENRAKATTDYDYTPLDVDDGVIEQIESIYNRL